jgi:uncharacterized protein YsxB (DUF464 family)
MIKVTVWKSNKQGFDAFLVEGHAGYAEHGQDIVCAAVSVLAQTAVLAIEKLTGYNVRIEMEDGRLYCRLPVAISAGKAAVIKTIIESMIIGLQAVAEEYPSYVVINQIRR